METPSRASPKVQALRLREPNKASRIHRSRAGWGLGADGPPLARGLCRAAPGRDGRRNHGPPAAQDQRRDVRGGDVKTLEQAPPDGAAHWSIRQMAQAVGQNQTA
jgi:hypothetical protein